MLNNQMTNYIMPTSVDLPPIRVFLKSMATFTARTAPRASENCRWMGLPGNRKRRGRRTWRALQFHSVVAGGRV